IEHQLVDFHVQNNGNRRKSQGPGIVEQVFGHAPIKPPVDQAFTPPIIIINVSYCQKNRIEQECPYKPVYRCLPKDQYELYGRRKQIRPHLDVHDIFSLYFCLKKAVNDIDRLENADKRHNKDIVEWRSLRLRCIMANQEVSCIN